MFGLGQPRTLLGTCAALLAFVACGGEPPKPAGAPGGLTRLSVTSLADPNLAEFPNDSGRSRTVSLAGRIDTTNPFFQSLGTNGRSCVTCHAPDDAWTVTPAKLRQRFEASGGLDPVFRPVDGANSPTADVTTVQARRAAYSMLLNKGLIRVGLPIPRKAEFSLVAVDDPYGHASASELSLFRRVLPSTNLTFLSTVMWDGRETFEKESIRFGLLSQSNGATLGHAQASIPLTDAQREAIVDFETGLFTSQVFDEEAGDLAEAGGRGGPAALSEQEFYLGINDPLGLNPTGAAFDPEAFDLYDAWSVLAGGSANDARAAVARGQAIFNTHPIDIVGVKGLNDDLGVPVVRGTCTTCHDSPNVGNHSVAAPLDIGLTDASRRTPDMPLYTLRHNKTGETVQTTDPGRALITGRWKDIGRFKGPVLRNLAARAPYFHDGSAASLKEAVEFYETRFGLGLSRKETADLIAFLRTL